MSISPQRVMLITADSPGGRSLGSGTLVAPSLVLTAAHVVFDDDGRPATAVQISGDNAKPVAGEVIWPSSYRPDGDDSAQLDAALVAITAPAWVPPRLPPVRWGRLTGRSTGVACEATGFPRALIGATGVRDVDQVSADVNPGSRRVTVRYDLHVTSAVPTPLRDRPSPWSGLSGAGVFAGDVLIGVVIVDERGTYSGDRLSALPVYQLARDSDFTAAVVAAGGTLRGPAQLESAELGGALAGLWRVAEPRRHPSLNSPAMLLRPDAAVVPFHGREELTAALVGWCQDTTLEVDVRLIIGPGGQGKTRLARYVADQLLAATSASSDHPGWVCGFLEAGANDDDLARLADTDAPLLIVLDYAETRSQQLRTLLPLLWNADSSQPVRVLLLARSAGEWWSRLTQELDGAMPDTWPLGALDAAGDRAAQFDAAVAAFAGRLTGAGAALSVPPPLDLDHDRYGSPLTLHLAALTALLEVRQPLAGARASSSAEETLLGHEERYWISTARNEQLNLTPPVLRAVVAAGTLCGADSYDDVAALARVVPGIGDLTQDQLHRLDTWFSSLYPPDAGQRWGGLQPDRIAEYLIAATLPARPGLLANLVGTTESTRLHRVLTILARAMANNAVNDADTTALAAQVRDALAGDLLEAGPIAAQVITETADPRPMLSALQTVARDADQLTLRRLVRAVPGSTVALAEISAEWHTRLIGEMRAELHARHGPTAVTSDLAGELTTLCRRLSAIGRRDEALSAITEAVDIYQTMAAKHPDLLVDLAGSLNNKANTLAALDRGEEALSVIDQAVDLSRTIATGRPDRSTLELATTLHTQSNRLSELGRHQDALSAITEAVDLYRILATDRPDQYSVKLADGLNNQSLRFAELGELQEALNASTEAIDIYRTLAAARPDSANRDLAGFLLNQAQILAARGECERALDVTDEAVVIRTELAVAHPKTFSLELGATLDHQFNLLRACGRHRDAVSAHGKAVNLCRKAMLAHPDGGVIAFARLLQYQCEALLLSGASKSALAASREAVGLLRGVSRDQPEAGTPALVSALANYAHVQAMNALSDEALASIREAVELHNTLARNRPSESDRRLVGLLEGQARILSAMGRTDQAKAMRKDIATIERRLRRPLIPRATGV
jgi:tetratricopeptide (TPR) repeat protein